MFTFLKRWSASRNWDFMRPKTVSTGQQHFVTLLERIWNYCFASWYFTETNLRDSLACTAVSWLCPLSMNIGWKTLKPLALRGSVTSRNPRSNKNVSPLTKCWLKCGKRWRIWFNIAASFEVAWWKGNISYMYPSGRTHIIGLKREAFFCIEYVFCCTEMLELFSMLI